MNKILLAGVVSVLFLIYSSYSSSVFAQEDHSTETIDHATKMGT